MPVSEAILTQILAQLETLAVQQQSLQAAVSLSYSSSFHNFLLFIQVDALTTNPQASSASLNPLNTSGNISSETLHRESRSTPTPNIPSATPDIPFPRVGSPSSSDNIHEANRPSSSSDKSREKVLYPNRVILTSEHTYRPIQFSMLRNRLCHSLS